MTVYRLRSVVGFPDPSEAEPDGLLAVGGRLSPEWLVAAYQAGIFPWFSDGEPILWWSPDPRVVMVPGEVHVSRSLAKTLRRGGLRVTMDSAFARVVGRCAEKYRPGQRGTWITPEMQAAYGDLHDHGLAHSVEVWEGDGLVGGLYGISLGGGFFGESMFSDRPDASKVALARLGRQLELWEFDLIDCQMSTEHLLSMGGVEVPRAEFLRRLATTVERPTRQGPWRFDDEETS